MKEKKRILPSGQPIAWTSPFTALKMVESPPASTKQPAVVDADMPPPTSKKNRGRVDIIRQTGHRGGKTVTVVTRFVGIGQPEKERLAKEMQQACGAGGTVKEGRIEIQGDQRETVSRILAKAGFRPLLAGG